jgi:hypothetical protein
MAYEDTSALSRQLSALMNSGGGGSYASGLAQGIKMLAAGKVNKKLAAAEQRNEANRAQELAMLIRGAETGRVGDFAGAATLGQAKFTDPTIQKLAAELRLKQATETPDLTDDIQEFNYAQKNPEFKAFLDRNVRQEQPSNRDLLQMIGQGGATGYIQYEPRSGSFYDMNNQPMQLDPSVRLTRVGAPTGALGDVVPQSKEIEMREAEAAIKTFNQTANNLRTLREKNPDAGTFVGEIATLAAGAMQEAEAVGSRLGIPREVFDPQKYDNIFSGLNISNPQLKSAALGFAIQAAAAQNLGSGRDLSNRDVERVLAQVGASYSDPAAFMAALQQVVDSTNQAFSNRYEALYKTPYQGSANQPASSDDGWGIVR